MIRRYFIAFAIRANQFCKPLVVFRAQLRLEIRKAMYAQGWITESQMQRGYETRTNPNCKGCRGRGWLYQWNQQRRSTVVCDCAYFVYVGRKAKKSPCR